MGGPAFDAIAAYLRGEEIPKWIPVNSQIYFPDMAQAEWERRTQ
jgi:hypothetical protein